jgi:hypothetical protein
VAEAKSGWSDQDRRMLLITVVGTLAANLATLVIVFGGIALIKGVETCGVPPSELFGSACGTHDYVPVWPLVWGITVGGAVAVGLILAAREEYRRLAPCGPGAAPHRLAGRLWPHWLRGREISDNAAERLRIAARAVQWVAGLYIGGVVVMWVGLASGLRPG